MYKKNWDKERLYELLCKNYEEIIYYCARKRYLSEEEKKDHFKRMQSLQMQFSRWRMKNFRDVFPIERRSEEYNKIVEEIKQEHEEVFDGYERIRASFKWGYKPNGTLGKYGKKLNEMSEEELLERRREYYREWRKNHPRYKAKGIWGKNGKRLSQMTVEEKREYNKIKQRESRRRKKENAKV
ncbi:MAG: hypothetical protein KBS91_02310 [Firmicutes bacterium]|nr:hypothetical protein [Candidatus Caballimonas caccae]